MIPRPGFLVILALAVITTSLNTTTFAGTQRTVRFTEVYLSPPGSFVGSQKVEITNLGTEACDIGGWCLRANDLARAFPLGTVLPPGGVLTIHVGAWGHNDNQNYYTGDDFPSLRRFWDSIELHIAGADFETPEYLADYVAWGGPYHSKVTLAVQAGIWELGDFLTAGLEAGESYQLCDRDSNGSNAWEPGAATIGIVNECLLVPTPVETTTWGKVKSRFLN